MPRIALALPRSTMLYEAAIAAEIFGVDRSDGGCVLVRGRPVRLASPRDAIRAGIGLLTEDRKGQGLVLELSIRENVVLPVLGSLSRFGIVSRRRERERAERYASDLRVKASSLEQPVLTLSGGNQQKVVLAKWLFADPQLLILDEPTRGIDVGAKFEIYTLMARLADEGRSILMISSEMPELLGMCDRIYVMADGRFVAELAAAEASQEKIMHAIVGAGTIVEHET